jgi:D-beta-D-heptose 7-phosphate kinase / D-beta-D-heptose 1-phosphate adenosyltransferase
VRVQDKVLELNRLLVRVSEWRDTGQVIVFTNGCFDLLHVGHIALLEQCRRFGDKVIVGVNSDASVRKLKGAGRPIVCECERAHVLAALAATDAVVVFGEETPLELICEVRPDVLVKGGDYLESSVVGAHEVRSWGGNIEIVPTVEGVSTSRILQKMASPAIIEAR